MMKTTHNFLRLPRSAMVLVLQLVLTSTIIAQRHWEEVAQMPKGVILLSAETVGERIYTMGGLFSIFLPTNEVYAFNPVDNTFMARASMPITAGACATAVFNEKIYLFGGVNSSLGTAYSFCYVYDPVLNQWSPLTSMSVARGYAVAETVGDKIYVIGGIGTDGGPMLKLVEEYDPATNTWATKASMPTHRGYMSSVVLNDKIYVLGGLIWPDNVGLNKVEVYDPNTNSWSTAPPLPTARLGLAAGVLNDTIYTVAGFNTNPLVYSEVAVVEGYTEGGSWFTCEPLPYPKHGLAAAVFDDNLYVFAGLNDPNLQDEVYAFRRTVGVSAPPEDQPVLFQNNPNPFDRFTYISVRLPLSCNIALEICDMNGQMIRVLEKGQVPAGEHQYTFDAAGLPAGIYYCRIRVEGAVVGVRKMVVMR